QLAHLSVKEYFLSEQVEVSFSKHLAVFKSHEVISTVCLTYLLSMKKEEGDERWEMNFPLARYAARQWTISAKACEGHDRENIVHDAIMRLFDKKYIYLLWSDLYDENRK